MKRLFALSALLAVLLSSAAYGKVRDFGRFTVNIPKGWTAEHEGSRVTLMKGRMIMEIVADSRGGRSLEAIAKEVAEQYGSSDLEDNEESIRVK
ncbi:MAG: hypothetical protein IJF90_03975 [Synergistaceae bacterium]|nr:hypothetical protein [Synergistaceae bacterium]